MKLQQSMPVFHGDKKVAKNISHRVHQFFGQSWKPVEQGKFYTAVLYYIDFLKPNATKQSKRRNEKNHCGY
jgi:hypothetical protein